MKNERLSAIVDCLLLEGRKSAPELARRFEVSTRTIYRDIDALCASGVPIRGEPGAEGGYSIDEGYRVDRSFLSPDEVADVSAVLGAFAAASGDRVLGHSLGKLKTLGPRGAELARSRGPSLLRKRGEAAKPRGALPPSLVADLSPWGTPGCDPERVALLRRAIAERRLVSFSYVDADGRDSERVVEPFSVVVGGTVWYLHAYCRLRSSFRLFKIARMRNPAVLPERYDPYARLPVPTPFAFEGDDGRAEEVELAVEGRLRQTLEENFPGRGEGPDAEGRWIYRFDYPVGAYLVNFLLYFGPGIVVAKPAALRDKLRAAAEKIATDNAGADKP